MQAREYKTMREVEDTFWWYRTLRGLTVDALASRLTEGAAILDAGCGTGGTMAALRDAGRGWRLSGFDVSPQAVELTRARGFDDAWAASVHGPPRDVEHHDALVSLDVLSCRGIDRMKALACFHQALKPGGVLVMNLPAFEFLRGSHDMAVATERRFTQEEVAEMVKSAGFEIEMVSYWNAWLFLPIYVWRKLSRLVVADGATDAVSDLRQLPAVMNSLLAMAAKIDAKIGASLRIPFGTSVFCVASKRKGS